MINVLIHAVPKRMWYVEKFMVPALREQGIEPKVFCDTEKLGNLRACLKSFSELPQDGDTWHIQDDTLMAKNFAERAEKMDGVVVGFCHKPFGDNPRCRGTVCAESMWHSFQCIRIPNRIAHEFCDWMENGEHSAEAELRVKMNKGDDFLFREFFTERHAEDSAYNAADLCEHVDWLIGGSIVNKWRGYICRNDTWTDEEAVEELKTKLSKARK